MVTRLGANSRNFFYRAAPEAEYIHVLEGRIKVHTEFYDPVVLAPGESIYLDSNMGHAYVTADGCEEATVLGVCSSNDAGLMESLMSLHGDVEAPAEKIESTPLAAASKAQQEALMTRRLRFAVPLLLLPILAIGAALPSTDYAGRVKRVLDATPLIDGHNDLPWEIHERFDGKLSKIDLSKSQEKVAASDEIGLMTDIPRLRRGQMGAQFWSVWVPAELHGAEAVQLTLQQIDIVKSMAARYPKDFEMAYNAADIVRIHRAGRIASLIGIEGGHQINNSLAVLRQMYVLGARYMTLTHSSNTDWADSATDAPKHQGLTPFGREVVHEMNRLGMLVDLSHVSTETMRVALETSAAPVMFSHSSARALDDHPRDVPDDILKLVAQNGGIVMVNFYPGYISAARNRWDAELAAERARISSPPFGGLYIVQPDKAKAALDEWMRANPAPEVTIAQVADHIDHIRDIAGIDHVGIGSDFDGIPATPKGLEGVDKYPDLFVELLRRGWTDEQLAKLAGKNMLRVLAQADAVGARLRTSQEISEASPES